MTNRVGQQLGNYQLIRELGRGGFAVVYLGEHLHLKTQAAVKVLDSKLVARDEQAFTKEAQTIASLKHPHILRVLDFDFDETTPFLVMEYASGGTLRDRHPCGSLLPLPTVISYVKPIAAALQHAHDAKVIHRDVKPENILVGDQQMLLLSDFGIAALAHSTISIQTLDGRGTPHYMAPEQFQNHSRPASDQYSFAIMVYEWLCGQRPFYGDTFFAIGMQHLSTPVPSLIEKNSAITPALEQIVFKALAKDPKQRFESVQAFALALEQVYQPAPSRQVAFHLSLPHQSSLPTEAVTSPLQPNRAKMSSPASTSSTRRSLPKRKIVLLIVIIVLLIGLVILIIEGSVVISSSQTPLLPTTQSNANATATALKKLNPHGGTLIFQDTLANNTNGWCRSIDCNFSGNALYITNSGATGPSYTVCMPQNPNLNFSNFVYQVQIKVLKGFGSGIIFRSDKDASKGPSKYYYFLLGTNGTYELGVSNGYSPDRKIKSGPISSILAGLNQTNLVTVVARRSVLQFYVNQHLITSVNDGTYTQGRIGLLAYDSGHPNNEANPPVEVVFSNAKVWVL